MNNGKQLHIQISDVISIIALILSIFSTFISYKASNRAEKIDNATAVVTIQSISEEIAMLKSKSKNAYLLLTYINEKIKENSDGAQKTLLSFIRHNNLNHQAIPQESIFLIAKIDSEAAKKIAMCSSMFSSIEEDMKQLSKIDGSAQIMNLQLVIFRFNKLSEACYEANASIEKYFGKNKAIRGTADELIESKIFELRNKNKNS